MMRYVVHCFFMPYGISNVQSVGNLICSYMCIYRNHLTVILRIKRFVGIRLLYLTFWLSSIYQESLNKLYLLPIHVYVVENCSCG